MNRMSDLLFRPCAGGCGRFRRKGRGCSHDAGSIWRYRIDYRHLFRKDKGCLSKESFKALRLGTYISAVLVAVGAFVIIRILLPGHVGIYAAVLSGLIAGGSDRCNHRIYLRRIRTGLPGIWLHPVKQGQPRSS